MFCFKVMLCFSESQAMAGPLDAMTPTISIPLHFGNKPWSHFCEIAQYFIKERYRKWLE